MSERLKKLARRGLNFASSQTAVLLYHRVAQVAQDPWGISVRPEHFAEHLDVIRSFGMARLLDAKPSGLSPRAAKCSIVVTFDDGYSDNYRNALPLLERYEIPATIFVTTSYLEKRRPFWWDELQAAVTDTRLAKNAYFLVGSQLVSLPPFTEEQPLDTLARVHPLIQSLDEPERAAAIKTLREIVGAQKSVPAADWAMTREELQAIAASSLVEIGAHTVTHPKLSSLSLRRQFEEIEDSKRYLEELLNRKVNSFSYPFGASMHYTQATEYLVKACGFQRICTTESAVYRKSHTDFRIPRLYVPDIDGERFSRWLWSYLNG